MTYVDTLIWFYSNCYFNRIGKEELKFDANTFLLELRFPPHKIT